MQAVRNVMNRGNPATTTRGALVTSYSVNSNNDPINTQRIKNANDWTPDTPTTQHVRDGYSLNNAVKSAGHRATDALLGIAKTPAAGQQPKTSNRSTTCAEQTSRQSKIWEQ